MNLRLQTTRTESALKSLKIGLKDLEETTNVLDDTFIEAVKQYYRNQAR